MATSRSNLILCCLAITIALAASVGCNKGEPRGDVAGTVQFDGKSVESGMISFESTQAAAPPRNVPIQNGQFRVDGKAGLKPGSYLVRVSAADTSKANAKSANSPNAQDGDFIPLLPASWNTQSKLTIDVKPGKNLFNVRGKKGAQPSIEAAAN